MANSLEGKFGNIFKLLSQHYSQLNVKDKYKCVKCKNILINACVTTCSCRFCRECVDKMLTSGCEKCPGNTKNCKCGTLSNIAPDHVMNMNISKLLVKCPQQMCEHECQVIEMEEHMRLCSKKAVQCPCHDVGCNDDDLVEDTINKHLQKESFNHWKMLMGLIGELRNEVAQLRRTENVSMSEIELLRNEGRAKDERIEEMRAEMTDKFRTCEVETEILKRQIDILKDNSDRKFESIQREKEELSGELGDLNGKVARIRVEVNARLDETRQGCMEKEERQLALINESMGKHQDQMAVRINEVELGIERNRDLTTFVWQVDEISKIGRLFGVRSSDYFFPESNPYKIKLQMFNYNSQLQIYLVVSPCPNDEKLQWPFQAKVRVRITNKAAPAVCVEDTKYCNIFIRSKDPIRYHSNNRFLFPIADLCAKKLLLDDCCILECLVDLK